MLERIDAPERTLAFIFSGTINANDVDAAITQIETALSADPDHRLNLYAEIIGLTGMTFDALVKDLRYGLGHFSEMTRRVGRMAVVAEPDWLRAVVRLEARLLPGIELRAFAPKDRDEALTWAAEGDEAPGAQRTGALRTDALRMIDTDDPATFAFVLDGRMHTGDVEQVIHELARRLEQHEHLRVLARIDHYDGFEPRMLLSRELWNTKLAALRQVDRYALVGGPEAFARMVEALDPLLRLEVRHFEHEDEEAAWRWLRG